MNPYRLLKITPISTMSINRFNSGQIPHQPKLIKTYGNVFNGEIYEINDVQSKLWKRNKNLNLFYDIYKKAYKLNKVTILGIVVNQKDYETLSPFISSFTKKLKRKGIERLGYVWIRDVGDVNFEPHYHIIFATSLISDSVFKDLFKNKKHDKYSVEIMKSKKGLYDYLKEKQLFGKKRQRTNGKSRKFLSPKSPI